MPSRTVILVTEDEPIARKLIGLILRDEYDILSAANGLEALTLSRTCVGSVDLLLTDIDLPGMNGYELQGLLKTERPALKVLFISGGPLHTSMAECQSLPFLLKPFDATTLRTAVRNVLEPMMKQKPLRAGRGTGVRDASRDLPEALHMSRDHRAHQEVERELWDEIQHTKAKYEDLNRDYSRMINETSDIGVGQPDGTLALAQSQKKHRELQAAIAGYRRALKRFNHHIIDG
jgi:CheY-like chemotaxis protein